MVASSTSSKSLILTWERRIPICTYRSPFWFGRVLTVPLMPMVRTFTVSPTRRAFGEMVFFGPLVLMVSLESTLLSCSRSLVRSASNCLPTPLEFASLLIFLMVWSAVSFASRKIRCASSLAWRIILSLRSSNRSSFCARRDFNWETSSL